MKAYLAITTQLGRANFDALVKRSDIWAQIQGLPAKYDQFMTEFFNFEQWREEQESKESAA